MVHFCVVSFVNINNLERDFYGNLRTVWWFETKCSPQGMVLLVGVASLEQTGPCWRKGVTVGMDFEVSYVQVIPSDYTTSCCLWIKMQNFQILLHHHVYLHDTCHDDNELNLRIVSQPQLDFSFIRFVLILVSLHSNENSNEDKQFQQSRREKQQGNKQQNAKLPRREIEKEVGSYPICQQPHGRQAIT